MKNDTENPANAEETNDENLLQENKQIILNLNESPATITSDPFIETEKKDTIDINSIISDTSRQKSGDNNQYLELNEAHIISMLKNGLS